MPIMSATRPNSGCSSGDRLATPRTRGSRTAVARRAHLRRGHPVSIEQRHQRRRRHAARERLDGGFISSTFTTRASRVAKRGSAANSGRPMAANTPRANGSVGAQIATQPSADSIDAEWREPRHHAPGPLRHAARSSRSNGSPPPLTSARRASTRRPAGRYRSRALLQRRQDADDAEQGATRSATGTPTRTGRSAGSPDVIIRPLSAWMMVSIALPLPPSPCRRRSPDNEQYTIRGFIVPANVVADAETIDRAGAEVLDDDVGRGEAGRRRSRARVGMLQVERGPELAAKAVQRRRRHVIVVGRARGSRRRGRRKARWSGTDRRAIGFSILITRAPRPASRNVAYGPARAMVRSTTVRPSSGFGRLAAAGLLMPG